MTISPYKQVTRESPFNIESSAKAAGLMENRMKKYKIGFISLGCSKNLCDTEVMLHHIATAGYEITPEEHEADVIIVNTCAFIESAKKESIDNILDVAWFKENKSLIGIVVTGCMAERYREQLLEEFPEIDAVLGVGSLDRITDAIDHVIENAKKKDAPKYTHFADKETCPLGGDRVITTGETMAYMKIAEGCSNRCTYCAIPLIRGGLRSRTIEELVSEAKDLEKIGIKELNIIAQDTSAYGFDLYGEYKLPELLRRITNETKIPWIRLLYCYPRQDHRRAHPRDRRKRQDSQVHRYSHAAYQRERSEKNEPSRRC